MSSSNLKLKGCPLCEEAGGEVLVQGPLFRVVLVDDVDYPGFVRVIWNAHVREMTDLEVSQRSTLMAAVCKVEAVLRHVLQPDKINLASLGNVVPHLHWHVVPRFTDDAHFPAPIWAVRRPMPEGRSRADDVAKQGSTLRDALIRAFAQ